MITDNGYGAGYPDPQSEYSGTFGAGHNIECRFNFKNTTHHVDWDNFRIYYVSGGKETNISYTFNPYGDGYGTKYNACFVVPNTLPQDAKIFVNAPYINRLREDKHKLTVQAHTVLNINFKSVNDLNDRMYGDITSDFDGTNSFKVSNNNEVSKYVFEGSKITVTAEKANGWLDSAFSFNGLKVYAEDGSGEFTVDKTSECLEDNGNGTYTLTMPSYDILVKAEIESNLVKNELIVNCANGECTKLNIEASRLNADNSIKPAEYNTSGYLFATPESGSNYINIDGASGEFWTNPAAAITKGDVAYTFSIKGKVNYDPLPYELKDDIKVEALGGDGNYTDVTEEVFVSLTRHPQPTKWAYYLALKPYNASLRISCTMTQKTAYKLYLSETLAIDGSRLSHKFRGRFLNADGTLPSDNLNKEPSASNKVEAGTIETSGDNTYLIGELTPGSDLYYKLVARDRSRTTLQKIEVWQLDANGQKVQLLDGYLPDFTNQLYNSCDYNYYGYTYFVWDTNDRNYSKFKQPMPEFDILIEAVYGESRTPVTVTQIVVDDDGNEIPAGEGFSVTLSGTPYDFGNEQYAFLNNNGSEIARADATESITGVTKSTEVTAVSTDAQNKYYFYRRKGTSNVSIKLNVPEGYIANISGTYLLADNNYYASGNIVFEKDEDGNYVISDERDQYQYGVYAAWDITIRYTKYTPITVVQKTGGVVAEGNKTALGTVTVTNAATLSAKPFHGFNVGEKGLNATINVDGTSGSAVLKLLSNEQTNSFTVAEGVKLKVEVKPDKDRIIKSVNAYVTSNGAEKTEFSLPRTSGTYTSAVYTADDIVKYGDQIRIEVEYASADKITVEVLNTDGKGNLVQNTIGASVHVAGSGALTDKQFQYVSGGTGDVDEFDVTTKRQFPPWARPSWL